MPLVPTILFRHPFRHKDEMAVASRYFAVASSRVGLQAALVVPRYGLWPDPAELHRDIALQQSTLITSLPAWDFIARLDYIRLLGPLTPRTWFDPSLVPEGGPYVVRGYLRSCRDQWATRMFAQDKQRAISIYGDLLCDPYYGENGVVIREYIPLRHEEVSIGGCPFAHEWRFFYCSGQCLGSTYYWANAETPVPMPTEAQAFADSAAALLTPHATYFTLDIAHTSAGKLIVVEVNEGCMSGLNGFDPETYYAKLADVLQKSFASKETSL